MSFGMVLMRRALAVAIGCTLMVSALPTESAKAEGADSDDGYVGPDNYQVGFPGVEFRQQDNDEQTYSWLGAALSLGWREVLRNLRPIMRSDVARYLYGFSNMPLNASVSVVDDQGVTRVGTRNISEKDGWIKIAVYGFGFSAPTVKVKFSQGKSSGVAKPKSIVCAKGKQQRTVTGAKPTCPEGWKQRP